ncbi:MAG: hypothetical protein MMC33_008062 [Icmadophila ericetorum]|nr:hypothetical protein [Icmadophila ericetorum]
MPFCIEAPRPRRLLKRSLDESDLENPRPPKRQQLLPTPPTPDRSIHESPRPNSPQPDSTASSEFSRPLKDPLKDVNTASDSASKKRCIEDWFAKTPPIRASSVPPRLPASTSPVLEGQRPLLEVLQEMSQSQGSILGRGSVASARSSRLATSSSDYRSTLYFNGISFDHTGEKIPHELRNFLDADILKERQPYLSPEAIAKAVKTAVEVADSPEGNIHDLTETGMLPIKRSDVGRGTNTQWYPDSLPRSEDYEHPLAMPKPDVYCGYLTGQRSTWTAKETAVIDHVKARRRTQPAKGNCFPFFVFEMKSEAMGGTIWQAENQAAGSGASCVSTMRWLFQEAYGSENRSVIDSIAFSACITHREAVFHVHFYSPVESRYYMSWIGTFETMRKVQDCNNMVLNIFDHGLETRQKKVREALAQLHPFPERWKVSRAANTMARPATGEDSEERGSNKSQRTE